MPTVYSEGEAAVERAWHRVHGNSEQTHVLVVDLGEHYAAVALDVDPREFDPVAADILAFDPTPEGAQTRAERWMETHPKGILGDGGDGGGGIGGKLVGGLRKLNDYGNDLAQQQQPQQSQEDS